MIFKDRADAGNQLAEIIKNDPHIKRRLSQKRGVIISLLRGGIIIGDVIAKSLKIDHLPLSVTKIPAPANPELAIGALCFDIIYLEKQIINSLKLDKASIQKQIDIAREKFNNYQNQFSLSEKMYNRVIDCLVILVDDGIATGSTIKTAFLFVKSKKPKKIFLASPVAPADFEGKDFDKVFILHQDPFLSAVSQYYQDFSPVDEEQIKKLLIY